MPRNAPLLLIISLAAGLGLGALIGWVLYPAEYVNTHPASLDQTYKDEYVLMAAAAFAGDGDPRAARERLAPLGFADAALAVQQTAARLAGKASATDLARLQALAAALAGQPPP